MLNKSLMPKNYLILGILLFILFTPSALIYAETSLQDIYEPLSYTYVNGVLINKEEGSTHTARGTVYVPLGPIVEGMGDEYEYSAPYFSAMITKKDGTQIILTVGRSYAIVNEKFLPIEEKVVGGNDNLGNSQPFMINDTFYVPISVITEYLKYPVSIQQSNDRTYTFIGRIPDDVEISTNTKSNFVLENSVNIDTEASADRGSTNSDVINYNVVLQKEGWIYYVYDGALYKMRPDGSEKKELEQAGAVNPGFGVMGDYIYFRYAQSTQNPALLYRIRTDGTGMQKLGNVNVESMNVVGNWIYYHKMDDWKLYKTSIDGKQTIKLSDDEVHHINVEGNYIYYANLSDQGRLYRMKTDGTGKEKLSDDIVYPDNHLVDQGYIYYTSGDNFIKMTVDGKNKTILVKGYPTTPYIVGDYIYISYYNEYGRKEMTDFLNDRTNYADISDHDRLFMRMKKDGTDKQYFTDVVGSVRGATKDLIYASFAFEYFGSWGDVYDYFTPMLKMKKNDLTSIEFFGNQVSNRIYAADVRDVDRAANKIYSLVNNTQSTMPNLYYNKTVYGRHLPMFYMEYNGTEYYMEACPDLFLLTINGTSFEEIKAVVGDEFKTNFVNIKSLLGKNIKVYAYTVDRDTDAVERVVLEGKLKLKFYNKDVPPKKLVKLSDYSVIKVGY